MSDESDKREKARQMRELMDEYRKKEGVSDISEQRKKKLQQKVEARKDRILKSGIAQERSAMERMGKDGVPEKGVEAIKENRKIMAKQMLANQNPEPWRNSRNPLHKLAMEEFYLKNPKAKMWMDVARDQRLEQEANKKKLMEIAAKRAKILDAVLKGAGKGLKFLGVAGSVADFLFNTDPIATDEQEMADLHKNKLDSIKKEDEEK